MAIGGIRLGMAGDKAKRWRSGTKGIRFVYIDNEWETERFDLRCVCGFQTEPAAIGFRNASRSGYGHDTWLIAHFDAEIDRLVVSHHSVPLDYALNGNSKDWRDTTVVPHMLRVSGNYFIEAPEFPTATRIWCPDCHDRPLIQQRLPDTSEAIVKQ